MSALVRALQRCRRSHVWIATYASLGYLAGVTRERVAADLAHLSPAVVSVVVIGLAVCVIAR